VVYNSPRRRWWPFGLRFHAYDVVSGERSDEGEPESAALAETLDAPCFATVPVRLRNETRGRLFLTACRPFDHGDPAFILQVIEHVAPVIENIRLVDRLASDAADEARQRIARDLHDSVIQPYIGLQIGLAACRQKLAAGNGNVEGDLERLLALTNEGIAELRGYVRGLKSGGAREASLIPAVRRFAARFGEATSIDVRVDAADNLQVNDRLAAEVFQLIAEGLSNIRRHTTSCKAAVELSTTDHRLCVRVENDLANGHPSPPFTPRSITERAAALGGHARVEQKADATAVVVEIPL
ncbi:MAG TPA: histidine kinase, partial [Herpetosiphonaceae bacterium]|nr:histidine kinase [Herpetosiphonaceae bacterium]